MAKELGISVITVKKAWERLENSGLIVTMARKGCFVAGTPSSGLVDRREATAQERLRKELPYYRALGLELDTLLRLVRGVYGEP